MLAMLHFKNTGRLGPGPETKKKYQVTSSISPQVRLGLGLVRIRFS